MSASHCNLCEPVVVSTQKSPFGSLLTVSFFFALNSVGRMSFILAQSHGALWFITRLRRLRSPPSGHFLAFLVLCVWLFWSVVVCNLVRSYSVVHVSPWEWVSTFPACRGILLCVCHLRSWFVLTNIRDCVSARICLQDFLLVDLTCFSVNCIFKSLLRCPHFWS